MTMPELYADDVNGNEQEEIIARIALIERLHLLHEAADIQDRQALETAVEARATSGMRMEVKIFVVPKFSGDEAIPFHHDRMVWMPSAEYHSVIDSIVVRIPTRIEKQDHEFLYTSPGDKVSDRGDFFIEVHYKDGLGTTERQLLNAYGLVPYRDAHDIVPAQLTDDANGFFSTGDYCRVSQPQPQLSGMSAEQLTYLLIEEFDLQRRLPSDS